MQRTTREAFRDFVGLARLIGAAGCLAACTQALAQRSPDPQALERARDEASRPMRWIIESGNLERRKAAAAAPAPVEASSSKRKAEVAAAPAQERNKVRAAIAPRAPGTEPSATVAAARETPPAAAVKPAVAATPAPMPAANEARDPATAAGPAIAVPHELSAATTQAQSASPAANPTKTVAAAAPVEPPEEEELVAMEQDPPEIWQGFCVGECEKYYFRVGFTVLPDGRVDKVRVISTNFHRVKTQVIAAVSRWTYLPVRVAREEEVVLRLSSQ